MNQYCDATIAPTATPSITASRITFGGRLACTSSIESFDLHGTGAPAILELSPNASFAVNAAATLEGDGAVVIGSGAEIARQGRADCIRVSPAALSRADIVREHFEARLPR